MAPKKLTHLLIVTLEDPSNPRSWSGTPFNLKNALDTKVDRVSVLSKLKPRRTLIHSILRLLFGKMLYPLYLTKPAQLQFAKDTAEAIRKLKPDAILSISSHCLLYLKEEKLPVFMFTDAPWVAWIESYKNFKTPMPFLGPRFGRLEAAAAKRCTKVVMASDWASNEACRLYQIPSSKTHAIPLGANYRPKLSKSDVIAAVDARPMDCINLLFVGKDWDRKGGPLALKIAEELKNTKNCKVQLHIVGSRPAIPLAIQDIVEVHGLLNFDVSADAQKMHDLFLNSHFLLVPTQAECFGLVFAEACAFALPSISTTVQALSEIVIDGTTGILQGKEDAANLYVDRILTLMKDRPAYRQMALAARSRYDDTFNWDHFAAELVKLMTSTL